MRRFPAISEKSFRQILQLQDHFQEFPAISEKYLLQCFVGGGKVVPVLLPVWS
jgi:hypothetical protein